MKTKVFLTIDTEFSIGGAFSDPVRNTPVGEQAVFCRIGEKSHGLGFLLDTFEEFGISATFFIETFNTYFFGDPPMRDVALRIKAAGHDLQLHLHPCWTYFKDRDWVERLKVDTPTDHMNGHSVAQLTEWLNDGIGTFLRWGLERPVALRTGSLIADAAVYQAMEACGLKLSSNIAFGVFQPKEPNLRLYSGLHQIGGVLEACVLTYIDRQIGRRIHHRSLTITGASWGETRSLLSSAHAAGVDSVVILTHPFEYVKYESPGYTNMYPSRINQGRLRNLCAFLADNGDRFEAATIGQLAARTETRPGGANVLLKAPWPQVMGRMLENVLNDRIKSL
jgi:peptidoglycan/xylan/chitin deacetylase (PgdA/CDA1 family)